MMTARLVIEPLRRDHAEEWYAALSDPRVSAFFDEPEVTTLEALRERIERQLAGPPADREPERWFQWLVRLAGDGGQPVIGRIEATTYGDFGEIAYVFNPTYWGQGYATEACEWLIEQLAEWGCHELWACVHPDNTASLALAYRLGFSEYDGRPLPRTLGSYDEPDVTLVRGLGSPRSSASSLS